jgi:hypothetical protein
MQNLKSAASLTCLLFVYWELTRDLFFLKNCVPIVSELFFGKEYAVKPMTWKHKV